MDASVWTPDKKHQVAELLRQGASAGQIARQFHPTTRNAIIGVVHRDKDLRQIGFANANRGQPALKPPTKKKPSMHKPDNRIAALIKPRLVNRKPDPEPRRTKPRLPLPPAWPIVPRHIPMIDIGICQCRFPMWDGFGAPDFLMCGADTAIEQSYCAGHQTKVFQARER